MTLACEDCRWYRAVNRCAAPQNKARIIQEPSRVFKTEPVEFGPRFLSAEGCRSAAFPIDIFTGACGRRARWFEAK